MIDARSARETTALRAAGDCTCRRSMRSLTLLRSASQISITSENSAQAVRQKKRIAGKACERSLDRQTVCLMGFLS
jgi:hypothetical protein